MNKESVKVPNAIQQNFDLHTAKSGLIVARGHVNHSYENPPHSDDAQEPPNHAETRYTETELGPQPEIISGPYPVGDDSGIVESFTSETPRERENGESSDSSREKDEHHSFKYGVEVKYKPDEHGMIQQAEEFTRSGDVMDWSKLPGSERRILLQDRGGRFYFIIGNICYDLNESRQKLELVGWQREDQDFGNVIIGQRWQVNSSTRTAPIDKVVISGRKVLNMGEIRGQEREEPDPFRLVQKGLETIQSGQAKRNKPAGRLNITEHRRIRTHESEDSHYAFPFEEHAYYKDPDADGNAKAQMSIIVETPGAVLELSRHPKTRNPNHRKILVTDTEGNQYYVAHRFIYDLANVYERQTLDENNKKEVDEEPGGELFLKDIVINETWEWSKGKYTKHPVRSVEIANGEADPEYLSSAFFPRYSKDPFSEHAEKILQIYYEMQGKTPGKAKTQPPENHEGAQTPESAPEDQKIRRRELLSRMVTLVDRRIKTIRELGDRAAQRETELKNERDKERPTRVEEYKLARQGKNTVVARRVTRPVPITHGNATATHGSSRFVIR